VKQAQMSDNFVIQIPGLVETWRQKQQKAWLVKM
jgi:hypothetical protein